jgi:hypothetical protein
MDRILGFVMVYFSEPEFCFYDRGSEVTGSFHDWKDVPVQPVHLVGHDVDPRLSPELVFWGQFYKIRFGQNLLLKLKKGFHLNL